MKDMVYVGEHETRGKWSFIMPEGDAELEDQGMPEDFHDWEDDEESDEADE